MLGIPVDSIQLPLDCHLYHAMVFLIVMSIHLAMRKLVLSVVRS
jgi:hypothetical protein